MADSLMTDARNPSVSDCNTETAGHGSSRDASEAAHAVTRLTARTHAPDLYLSALLAPHNKQKPLIALAAFVGEIDRIILTVSEPSLAEIRLQWWRDALRSGIELNTLTGSPVADSVIATARGHQLGFDGFDRALDARILDLYADPLPGEAGLTAYLDATTGFVFRSARRVVDPATTDDDSALVTQAARTYGRAILLCKSAAILARGRSPFPGNSAIESVDAFAAMSRQRIAETHAMYQSTHRLWRAARATDRLACLPTCLVPPYLAALGEKSNDARTAIVGIAPITRTWRLWRTYQFGRL